MRLPTRSPLVVALVAALALSACSEREPAVAAADPATDAASAAAAAEPARPSKQYGIADFVDTISMGGASFSADESRILFSSNKSGIWNAYTIPVTGGDWTAVTKSTTDSTYAVSFFPKDDRVLGFIASRGERDLLVVETSRGAEQTVSTAKYDVTGRGGKGRELMQRGGFVRVVPGEVVLPALETN